MALPLIPILAAGMEIAKPILNALFPDPEERAKAELKLIKAHQDGELKSLEVAMSAIVMEAKSKDPWTSRARPSFLYVIYILVLMSVPMGALHAAQPETAAAITVGFKAWLGAIPEPLWMLFGAGYLGYGGLRSFDKRTFAQGFKQ